MFFYSTFLAVFLTALGCGILAAVFLPTACIVVVFGLLLICIGAALWRCRRR
ncbi:MAG: hypothetical protein ACOX7F_08145 [Eubacteriales bacterium]|jgi:hypothetical protein